MQIFKRQSTDAGSVSPLDTVFAPKLRLPLRHAIRVLLRKVGPKSIDYDYYSTIGARSPLDDLPQAPLRALYSTLNPPTALHDAQLVRYAPPSETDAESVYTPSRLKRNSRFVRHFVKPGESSQPDQQVMHQPFGTAHLANTPLVLFSHVNCLIKRFKIMRLLFSPIDVVGEAFPRLQSLVIVIELFVFCYMLYQLSLLIDAFCMTLKALCAPIIAIGKVLNWVL